MWDESERSVNTLGYRVKKLGELVRAHLDQIDKRFSKTSFQILSRKLFLCAEEAGPLSRSAQILRNLSDSLLEISPERKDLIKAVNILIDETLIYYEADRYHFIETSSFPALPPTYPRDFRSQRMREASFNMNVQKAMGKINKSQVTRHKDTSNDE